MKTIILAFAVISSLSTAAFAEEICGTLAHHNVGPKCGPNEMCPMFFRLQYDLTTSDGTRYDLETSEMAVFDQFSQLNGSNVCISGSIDKNGLEVAAISAE